MTGRNTRSIQSQTGRSKVFIDSWFIRSIRSKTGRIGSYAASGPKTGRNNIF